MPSIGHLRFQVWSNIAYGAKGIQYFTYWTPTPGTWDFHDAPIKLDGTQSGTYELLQNLNRDIQRCAKIILEGRVVDVFLTEPLPKGTRAIDTSSPFAKIEGGAALVGLHVLPDGSRHALVVHRSIASSATLELTLAPWVEKVSAEHEVGGVRRVEIDGRKVKLELEAGAGVFLRIHPRG